MPNRELTGPRLRILQVEDNETNRKIAERVLSREGHEVISVVNGAEALERLDNEEFDIILMDRDMPVMNGVEATRRIRADGGATGLNSNPRDHGCRHAGGA